MSVSANPPVPSYLESPRLSSADLEQIATFEKVRIGHPKLLAVHKEVISFVRQPADTNALLIAGPTGVGKTTLMGRVVETLDAEFARTPVMTAAGKRIGPPAAFDTPPATAGNFAWTEWYRNGLEALDHPAPDAIVQVPDDPRLPIVPRKATVGDLKRVFVQTARNRPPAAIATDESQHLTEVGQGQRLISQLEMVKTVASETGRPILLFGTYALVPLRNLSGQLGRRCRALNFSRYDIEVAEDWTAFQNVLRTFATHLPIEEQLLLANDRWIYTRCAGCVGALKQWFTRALVDALESGTPEIGIEQLDRTALPIDTLTAMAEEIGIGEASFVEEPGDVTHLEQLLGVSQVTEPKARRPRAKRLRRPGRRRPIRDAVGRPA